MRELVEFFSNGNKLSGVIEHARISTASFAVIVHCFTCGKDSLAVSRVSKALSELGISVLRFDLTGIGKSEGDFPDTNFSSNLDDVIAAIDYLTLHYRTPSNRGKALLIMHSPDDRVVPMSEADVLYDVSDHPKSIISLVKADHMLTNKQDADFIASVIAIWTRRYLFL